MSTAPHIVLCVVWKFEENDDAADEGEGGYEEQKLTFPSSALGPHYSWSLVWPGQACCIVLVWPRVSPETQRSSAKVHKSFANVSSTYRAQLVKGAEEEDKESVERKE